MRKTSVVLFILLIFMIIITWFLSSKTGAESTRQSKLVAKYIENIVAENFIINRNDTFWRITINHILRKVAHFLEYMIIGMLACAFLNELTRRVWVSAVVSIITCPLLAYIDEYIQTFAAGRTPRWFDVQIDTFGAIIGVLLTSGVYGLLFYIKSLRAKIRMLEEKNRTFK
ncbi:MAG: VanZ family protein [Clostridia bacterium]|nr:VanZ family protein [Clostridia bacterium]